jgi:ATP-dependent 26S proteasome regulatory subunit
MSIEHGPISPEALQALREAVRLAPDNVPLRQHFAQTLLGSGFLEEAEREFRRLLSLAPNDEQLKLGLASAFYQQNKNSHALVIIEDLIKTSKTPARAHMLHARLCYRAGEIPLAVRAYHAAIEADPSVADAELSARLGIRATPETSEVVEGKVRAAWEEPGAAPHTEIERPKITFKDVGGMDTVKEEIRMKIIHPLTHPELYKAYGKPIGGGILMYGPPGCGKTYLARATAGEIKAGFLAVGINEVLDMWIGQSERNLHELFEQARSHKPCVLFFDEVDALGASRTDMRQSAGRQLINQFLAELDGVQSDNEGVLILAATNAPWHLDSAFRRPGRFDRILFVPPPDAGARAAILRIQCKGKPMDEIDFEHVAKKAENFSGADLKSIVDVAVENKLREAMKAGVPRPLSTKDLLAATGNVRPSTKEWFATARNYALYSNQGGIYDDILSYLKIK